MRRRRRRWALLVRTGVHTGGEVPRVVDDELGDGDAAVRDDLHEGLVEKIGEMMLGDVLQSCDI